MYPIWLFKGADEELGGESLADTDAPACQTGASWAYAALASPCGNACYLGGVAGVPRNLDIVPTFVLQLVWQPSQSNLAIVKTNIANSTTDSVPELRPRKLIKRQSLSTID
jgi:hypothetical protein